MKMSGVRIDKALLVACVINITSIAIAQPLDDSLKRLTRAFEIIRDDYVQPVDMAPLSKFAEETIRQSSGFNDAGWTHCMVQEEAGTQSSVLFKGADEAIADAFICAAPNKSSAQRDAIADAAIRATLAKLDEHGHWYAPDEFKSLFPKSPLASVGLTLKKEPVGIVVVHAASNASAALAGVAKGDIIAAIDDVSTVNLSVQEAAQKLRGPANTEVTLTLRRINREVLKLVVSRKAYSPIESALEIERRGSTLVIQLYSIPAGIADAVKARVMGQQGSIKTVILDLRDNPGGLLDQSVALADLFLERAVVVTSRGRTRRDVESYWSKSGQVLPEASLIVLINKQTAAGAEILAAAIQDNKRGLIFGEASQGAGTVQTLIPVGTDYALRLTTSYEYRPDGKRLVDEPVTPDCPSTVDATQLIDTAIAAGTGGGRACHPTTGEPSPLKDVKG